MTGTQPTSPGCAVPVWLPRSRRRRAGSWAESKIKSLTGGDKICGAFHAAGLFRVSPRSSSWPLPAIISPVVLNRCDEAIRRRFNLIPFTVHIPPEERDETLTERLKAEWPGILAWMVQGCLNWQREGLAPPVAVTAATAEYLESEDALTSWIEDKCEHNSQSKASSTELFVFLEDMGRACWRTNRNAEAVLAKDGGARVQKVQGSRGERLPWPPHYPVLPMSV